MKQVSITGHIGADAVTKEVNGSKFVEFKVAVNEKYKKASGAEVEITTWFTCTTKNLKLAEYLRVGEKVLVQGAFSTNVYQDKDRNWKVGIDIRAAYIELLSERKEPESADASLLRKIIREELKRA